MVRVGRLVSSELENRASRYQLGGISDTCSYEEKSHGVEKEQIQLFQLK